MGSGWKTVPLFLEPKFHWNILKIAICRLHLREHGLTSRKADSENESVSIGIIKGWSSLSSHNIYSHKHNMLLYHTWCRLYIQMQMFLLSWIFFSFFECGTSFDFEGWGIWEEKNYAYCNFNLVLYRLHELVLVTLLQCDNGFLGTTPPIRNCGQNLRIKHMLSECQSLCNFFIRTHSDFLSREPCAQDKFEDSRDLRK